MNELTLLPAALKYAPGTQRRPALNLADYQSMGDIETWEGTPDGLLARSLDGAALRIQVLTADMVRVTITRVDEGPPPPSWALSQTAFEPEAVQISERGGWLEVLTGRLQIRLHRQPAIVEFYDASGQRRINADWRPVSFEREGPGVVACKRLGIDEHFYGLGEKAARLDKRRGRFTMWTSDKPAYMEGTDPLYQSIPFYIGLEGGQAYGIFFDNSYRSEFDFGRLSQEYVSFSAEGGTLDYYFMWGPSIARVVELYSMLTGFMPLPPRWSLGHQQSRYSYYPDALALDVVRTYRAHDLPLDAIHLDIHYMDGYRVFTWHPQRFPDPAALTARLRAMGVRVIVIVDPGVKYEPTRENGLPPIGDTALSAEGYPVFDEGVRKGYFQTRPDGSIYVGEVWPGKSVFVDYTLPQARDWWGDWHRVYTQVGVAGIWNDMNEPADFTDQSGEALIDVVCQDRGARTTHAANRNVFALLECQATYEGLRRLRPLERPFVLTRAGFSGIQRYAAVWTGDNNSTWDHLALTIPMFASMGLSGVSFVGADIGGFVGRCSGELLVRWYQAAFLSPFCRNHKAVDAYDQEPWRFGSVYEDVVRRYLKLRYRLLPYLYTAMETASRTGAPVFRPLLFDYQHDDNTWNLDDQFLVGSDLLIAPILQPGATTRRVYLPAGLWYDFWTGRTESGGRLVTVEAPLDTCPLFIRGGAILPLGPEMSYTDERPVDPLTWMAWPDADGCAQGELYEDDGQSWEYQRGALRRTRAVLSPQRFEVQVLHDGYQPPPRRVEVLFPAPMAFPEATCAGRSCWHRGALRVDDSGDGYTVALH